MDLGVGLALGGRSRTLCYVEREGYSAAVLVARMEDEALDCAPVWDDLGTFGRDVIGGARVDYLCSGLPCQPYSNAGARKGHDDERAIWPEFVRITDELEPALVFLENVPPFLKHAEPVWRELRRLGFEWAPPLLHTSSEAGAPHARRRFFAVAAHRKRIDARALFAVACWVECRGKCGEFWCIKHDEHASGCPCPEIGDWSVSPYLEPPDAGRERLQGLGESRPTARPIGRGRRAKTRDGDAWTGWEYDPERVVLRHDSERCGDGCRICGTPWATESPVLRVDAGSSDRVDRLRAIGNVGTAPVVYALAFRRLLAELGLDLT